MIRITFIIRVGCGRGSSRRHHRRFVFVGSSRSSDGATAATVLHDRGELGLLLEQRNLGALPVKVGDAGRALETDEVVPEVVAGHRKREPQTLDAVSGGDPAEVVFACLATRT